MIWVLILAWIAVVVGGCMSLFVGLVSRLLDVSFSEKWWYDWAAFAMATVGLVVIIAVTGGFNMFVWAYAGLYAVLLAAKMYDAAVWLLTR